MMDKINQILKSRYFKAGFCIALVIVELLIVFILLNKFFLPITVLGRICYIGVVLYVLNKDEVPDFKIPWLILLFMFSTVGAFVFILIVSNETNKKMIQKYDSVSENIKEHQVQSNIIEEVKESDLDAYAQMYYLNNTAEMPCYGYSNTTYYQIGEEFHKALLESLKTATKFIFMEYFIVEEGVMWDSIHEILKEKVQQGVQVCVMYDDFGCMGKLREDYYKELCDEGIHCIPSNKFTPSFSRIHNNRDHRKISVIDGKIGFTGGINLADEYINVNSKLGHWKDTAIKIEGAAVNNLTELFLTIWNLQNDEILDYSDYRNDEIAKFDEIVIPYGDGPAPLYNDSIGKNVYINMINTAKKYVYITTPYLICDHEMTNALRLAAKRGVDVRVITPYVPDKKIILLITRSSYKYLIEDGVKIYEYEPGFIHAKNMICDDKFAICGTINWDYRSLVHHFECAAWIYKSKSIVAMKEDFINTVAVSKTITEKDAKLKFIPKFIAEFLKAFTPLL